ncbi:hypothetical protein A5641_20300 [Mycobacterium sp. 1554424.7]|nr:hypothetical protein A5641_20300 [Mycobacterium sp. 1554424.7]
MAIGPFCVGCIPELNRDVAGLVEFADYDAALAERSKNYTRQPSDSVPQPGGGGNSLGVMAAEGIGTFCGDHLKRARRLRYLPSAEAVRQLRSGADLKPLARLANLFRSAF